MTTWRIGPAIAVLLLAGCTQHPATNGVPLADGSQESVTAAIDTVTTFPTELDQRLWNGTDLEPVIRDRSLSIVDRIVKASGIPGLTVDAVELFGSNASYEYDDTSDFGIHVFTHSESIPPDLLDGLLRLLNDDVERRQEGRITFNGVVLEVIFHGERGENYRRTPGIGQYSLSEDRWIERPVRQPDNFDRAQMATDISRFIGRYNDLATRYADDKKGFDCSLFGNLDAEMSAYRNTGFTGGLGSRSTQNLAYRALRRITVNIPEAVDTLEEKCTFLQESIG